MLNNWEPKERVEYLKHYFWFLNVTHFVGSLFVIIVYCMFVCMGQRMRKFSKKNPEWFEKEPRPTIELENRL